MKIPNQKFCVEVITPEISAEIQKKMFSLGYSWMAGGKEVKHTNQAVLYFDAGRMTYGYKGSMEDEVSRGKVVKVSIEDIFSFVPRAEPLKVGILQGYPITLEEDGLRAGCKFIPRKDFDDLVAKAKEYYSRIDSALL